LIGMLISISFDIIQEYSDDPFKVQIDPIEDLIEKTI